MNAPLNASTRVGLVVETLRSRIDSRALGRGARLPSVRKLADELDVSRSTVVEGYDRLAALGLVEARRGSGFFVAQPPRPLVLAEAPRLDPAVDLLALVRRALEDRPDVLQPASGWLPESWLPSAGLEKAVRALARGVQSARLRYDSPFGFEPLRRLIAARLAERGAPIEPDRIVLTNSTTQALDLALRFLLRPGDRVVVDDPHYYNFRPLIRAHRAEIDAAPYTREGPDLAELEAIFAERRPRVYLMVCGPHNPTGATISASTAHRVLTLAEKYDVVIVEDDIYGDFETMPGPRLAAFDGFERVILIGGYSKTVSAALRVSYLAGRDRLGGSDRRPETGDDARQFRVCSFGHSRISDRGRVSPSSRIRCGPALPRRPRAPSQGLKRWARRRGSSRRPACSSGPSFPGGSMRQRLRAPRRMTMLSLRPGVRSLLRRAG